MNAATATAADVGSAPAPPQPLLHYPVGAGLDNLFDRMKTTLAEWQAETDGFGAAFSAAAGAGASGMFGAGGADV